MPDNSHRRKVTHSVLLEQTTIAYFSSIKKTIWKNVYCFSERVTETGSVLLGANVKKKTASKLFLLKLHSVHFSVVILSFHHRDLLDKWVNGTCPYDSP